jgi:hypothetical protein
MKTGLAAGGIALWLVGARNDHSLPLYQNVDNVPF